MTIRAANKDDAEDPQGGVIECECGDVLLEWDDGDEAGRFAKDIHSAIAKHRYDHNRGAA